ncbi:MAG TPA: SUMF1/EgtB/PvdO family nonheme iron enzyme [Kofleriaceae bacterium]|nr:SUMF1/EgtB/PvdO family nonheme iron enzyme [Kofleriaceae bacterium]
MNDVAAPISRAADAQMVTIPAGRFVSGSTPEERAAAYDAFLASSGRDVARANKWFENEDERHVLELPAFAIDLMPVTNAAYAEFVDAGGAPAPTMDEATWKRQGFDQDWKTEVERFVWKDGHPPPDRVDHPVVLVTWDQASAYCAWRGRLVGATRRLPTAIEFEKAARGQNGDVFPWGEDFDATKLVSRASGTDDTAPVGSLLAGKSAFGVLDVAGNIYQWTSTPWPPGTDDAKAIKMTVKGSAWDDWAGLGRGAQRHGRDKTIRHAIVGFRCAGEVRS